MEIWKDIPGYEGLYQASKYGQIKALTKTRSTGRKGTTIRTYPEVIMTPSFASSRGYGIVALMSNGERKYSTVHRLIATTFLDNCHNFPCINHKDGNKRNNAVLNLEWCTYKHNSKHAYNSGLQKGAFGNLGVKNPAQKRVLDTKTGKQYDSIACAARSLGLSVRSLYHQFSGDQDKTSSLNLL